MNERTVDRVALAGVLLGFGSLALGFMQVRSSRVATGVPYPLWRAAPPELTALLLLLLLAALFLALPLRPVLRRSKPAAPGSGAPPRRHGGETVHPATPPELPAPTFPPVKGGHLPRSATAALLGLTGDLIIVAVFVTAGLSVHDLLPPGLPYARVGLAPGSWLCALSGYILVLAALQGMSGRNRPRAFLVLLAPILLVALAPSGIFSKLSIVEEFHSRENRFFALLGYHLVLSLSVTAAATIIGMPLGIWARRRRASERSILGVVGTLQTIPSLALFGLLIAPLSLLSHRFPVLSELGISGVGTAPAFIALTLYALLPIVRNTYTGLAVVEPGVVEAGRGMGMSKGQLFLSVELPLALPVIMSGIRISLVQAIGNTTVAALIGAGGLGVFIFQGLGQAAPDLILLGTLPVILLAVVTDRLAAFAIRALTPRGLALSAVAEAVR